jgi:hypothetical protein
VVCRENKARSVLIGLNKHYLRQDGWTDYTDNEFQSAFHDYGHRFEDAEVPSEANQRKLLEGLRASIEQDPRISDADKYRPARPNARTDNPGLITRIDQEIKRLETGVHERTGKPLTNAQKMGGKQWASIQRLSAFVQRTQPAKDAYIEMNARHRGIDVDEARTEWKKLVDVPPKARVNDDTGQTMGQISLQDTYRDDLSVAGLTSEQQADVSQSAATRYAVQEMEKQRKEAIRRLPSRPAVDDTNTIRFTRSGGSTIKCETCGQFGHEAPGCPNEKTVGKIKESTQRAQKAEQHLARVAKAKERLSSELDDLHSKEARARGNEAKAKVIEKIKSLRSESNALEQKERRLIGLRDYEEDNAAQFRHELIQSSPQTSNLAETVAYNPATGYLRIRVRDKDGNLRRSEYRLSRQEYEDFMASDDHRAFARKTFRRPSRLGGSDQWDYENPADTAAARQLHQCPTCGRWASLTSSHTCPVPGSRRAEDDTRLRADASLAGKDTYNTAPVRIGPGQSVPLAGGLGTMDFADARAVTEQAENDQTVNAMISGRFPDGAVTGHVTVWDDRDNGRSLSTTPEAGANARCTCDEYRKRQVCRHIGEVARRLSGIYGATKTADRTPAGRAANSYSDLEASDDAPDQGGIDRVSYNRIMNSRLDKAADAVVESSLKHDAQKVLAATWPRDSHGEAITGDLPPTVTYENPPTKRFKHATVDVRHQRPTQEAIRAGLRARTGKHWSVTHEGGVLRITASRKNRREHGALTEESRTELAKALNVPRSAVGSRGVTVPGEHSWHHEYVNRAFGQEPSVYGRKPAPRYSELSDHDRGI